MELFKGGRDRLRENGVVAMAARAFRVLLLGTNPQAKVDVNADTTLDAVVDNHRENARAGDVAARLQVIGDPTKPFGIRDRLYQFFVQEGSRDTVRGAMGSAVLYEQDEQGEYPIAFLNRDDLGRMISGEGATITLPYQEGEASAPVPVATPEAQEVSIRSDADANAVADEAEYVDGDPDKGVRADAGLERVGVVGLETQAKAGTTAEEGNARFQTEPAQPSGGEPSQAPPQRTSSEAAADQAARDEAATEESGDEAQVDVRTSTKPTQLQDLGVTALRDYARENEIEVTRGDGEAGRPVLADYAKAVANFNRRQQRQA